MSDEDYATVLMSWHKDGMRTVRDLLAWYNNLDIELFLQALEMQTFVYAERGIYMLKDAVSLPGLSTMWMFSIIGNSIDLKRTGVRRTSVDPSYADIREAVIDASCVRLIDTDNADLHNLFNENTVSGPSLVFQHYHERHLWRRGLCVPPDCGL